MNIDVWMQVLRYVLIGLGSVLAGHGIISDGQAWVDQVVNAVPGIIAIGTALWGVWVKLHTKSVPAYVAERPSVPTVSPVTGAIQK